MNIITAILCKSHLVLGILFFLALQTSCEFEDLENCTSSDNCGTQAFCIHGICSRCVDCELEYNRKPGNNSALCPLNKTNNCGECLPNFGLESISQNGDGETKCELINDDSKVPLPETTKRHEIPGNISSSTTEFDMFDEDELDLGNKNEPWPYVALVGAFLFIFSGLGTFLSWKYQPMILKMKKHRQNVTIKYRQKCEDIRNASVKEKQKLNTNDDIIETIK